ncbi:MAG: hypothetical protein J6Y07_02235 [Alphaproteobacteria bacterium]|nr:hypothetical protein [Alphaproteobacteria bacterium]
MKKLFFLSLLVLPCMAVADLRDPRVGATSMVASRLAPAQGRVVVASKNQITTPDISISTEHSPSIKADALKPSLPQENKEKDKREAERAACLNNNIGIGNTFVWASKFSNTNSYATMQEDMDNPENNVCFVKVDLKSADARVNMSDIQSRYFQWGQNINCGSWVDEELLRTRILDAKKTGRALATVGGAVGGAAVGVGAMELFGNRLIGGKVEGQKNKKLNQTQLLKSQLLTLKNNKDSRYDTFMSELRSFKAACDKYKEDTGNTYSKCENLDYDSLLAI